jgi:hypothetical protein
MASRTSDKQGHLRTDSLVKMQPSWDWMRRGAADPPGKVCIGSTSPDRLGIVISLAC